MSALSHTAPAADLPILAPEEVVSSGEVSA